MKSKAFSIILFLMLSLIDELLMENSLSKLSIGTLDMELLKLRLIEFEKRTKSR